jgi:propionyl-CoA carboxylase alpha chain
MYLVKVDQKKEFAIDLIEARRGTWHARLHNGKTVALQLRGRDDNGDFIVVVDGEEHVVGLHRNGRTLMSMGELTAAIEVTPGADIILDDLGLKRPDKLPHVALTSPITGIVVEVLVETGMAVKAGQALVVVEAMKMENTLVAAQDGIVREIPTEAGRTVFVGDELVLFE